MNARPDAWLRHAQNDLELAPLNWHVTTALEVLSILKALDQQG